MTFIQAGSNRGVTGQTVEAFWNSISHVPLLSVGMNCALGPKEMRPFIEELSQIAPDLHQRASQCRAAQSVASDGVSGNTESLAPQLREWAAERLVEHRRWLLRDDTCAHQTDCRGCSRDHARRVSPSVEPYTG